jgi:NADPH:quinone reductase
MQAIEISQPGGPQVLRLVERARPALKAGEVLIRVAASGVNRPDVLQRSGAYPPPPDASDLPGLEVAGELVEGDAADLAAYGLKLGDPVCALCNGGGYAEFVAVPVGQVLPVPQGWSVVEAASLPETAFTVWVNVFERAALQSGETLLVHGGTSGIGVTAIQLAKAMGATVIATAGSDDKCAACVKLGADHAINYRAQDFVLEAKRLTAGKGVNVVLDMVAGSYVARNVECLADDGRLSIIAVQGGVDAQFNAGLVLRKRLTITGSTLRPRTAAFKASVAKALREQVWPLAAACKLQPVLHSVFDVQAQGAGSDAPNGAVKAHELMESNAHIGKIVLRWA